MVSIVIPWIREAGLIRCIKSIERNIENTEYEIVEKEDKKRIGVPLMVKELTDRSKYDLVMFLADDVIVHDGFMDNCLSRMNSFDDQWGLVGLNDQVFTYKPATHWLAHKKLLPFLDGYFFNPCYLHNFCDEELTQRCVDMNRYKWANDALLTHFNPVCNINIDFDKDYNRIYNPSNFYKDKRLYNERKRNNWKS